MRTRPGRAGGPEDRRSRHRRRALLAVLAMAAGVAAPPWGGAAAQPPAGQPCDLPSTGPVAGRPWAQQRLDYERAWPLSQGAGVLVAVVDTGVYGAHPQLAGRVRAGVDLVNGGTADTDCVGHGTLVAGLIAARPVTGTAFAGVAPAATILPIRVSNSEQGSTGPLAQGIVRAVQAGARVINISVVVDQSTPALRSAVETALAHDVVVVAAAGNDYSTGSPVQYPAGYPGVLGVGAVAVDGTRASFSEAGGAVGVVAPGVDIVGPGAGGPGLVAGGQGTSYATALVSGVAALVRAYHPELSATQVVDRIERTADHPPTSSLPDPQLGWGTVDPYAALTMVLPPVGGSHAVIGGRRLAVGAPGTPDHTVRDRATLLAGLALVIAVAVAAAALALPRLRRRQWRPGRRPASR